ncbi:MAG: aminoacyl-tRNA hydrolase [Streptococcaceae bacterium]|jgi:PTH1 family peptidyl-tRNA hydrolase|nr:aminoacyl-tRNA hydrolase [Streptococcaceae bacterium]
MKMIVGLGNPGEKYLNTRHNVGFITIDKIAYREGISFKHEKIFEADVASFFVGVEKVYLVKPTTFINESGRAVKPLMTYFNIPLSDLVIIYDDLDMDVGRVRLRMKGSAGGHNGVKSLIYYLDTQKFNRIKLGIGHPGQGQFVVNYVLGNFLKEEKEVMNNALKTTVDAVSYFSHGHSFMETMNRFN